MASATKSFPLYSTAIDPVTGRHLHQPVRHLYRWRGLRRCLGRSEQHRFGARRQHGCLANCLVQCVDPYRHPHSFGAYLRNGCGVGIRDGLRKSRRSGAAVCFVDGTAAVWGSDTFFMGNRRSLGVEHRDRQRRGLGFSGGLGIEHQTMPVNL